MPSPTEIAHQFDSIEDSIAAFKNGEFIIVLDSQDRENEGDLIIAAESVTAAQMAFLVRFTSGLICAPITPDLATRLALPQMVAENADPKCTAYTVTIDSSDDSVTTAQIDSFRRPGHIVPLQARPGGVRERTGHTEAAVDFCKLAGKAPAGVIAELVEEGEVVEGVAEIGGNNGMMRRDGCLRFGKKWGIKVCTIEDLVIYLDRIEGTGAANGKH
ncbi:3-4-dihydroxy-2-butanone 4-phosphate synthase RibB [Penicillium cf. griseofulvum]|nr:3-4-dihydroxy-2-butanone 4-phosphate synthase RibB [Penicillium cf. griseofulvum]